MSHDSEDIPLRTLVLDPDPAQRAIVQQLLEGDEAGRFSVVGTFSPTECPVPAVVAFAPDLILLDPDNGEKLDLALVRRLVGSIPRARVVVRTRRFSLEALQTVTALGASGYLTKLPQTIPALSEALALTGRHSIFICVDAITNCVRVQLAAQALLAQPCEPESGGQLGSGAPANPRIRLTQTEQLVLNGLVSGWTHGEIARVMKQRLGRGSVRTVERLVSEMQEKYEVRSPYAMVLKAAADGYLRDGETGRDPV